MRRGAATTTANNGVANHFVEMASFDPKADAGVGCRNCQEILISES